MLLGVTKKLAGTELFGVECKYKQTEYLKYPDSDGWVIPGGVRLFI